MFFADRVSRWIFRLCGVGLLWVSPGMAWPEVRVTDDTGQLIHLDHPVSRIVSLAPNITELLFAAGAGDAVVGTSEFSDYPGAARQIPRVGGGGGLDLEAIVALEPDLVIAWQSGNPAAQVDRLRRLGLQVFVSEPRHLQDIATTLEAFGELTGNADQGRAQGAAFMRRYEALRAQYSLKAEVRVFFQVWNRPLMTVNGKHVISDVIRLCGGRNVFAELPELAPQIGIEAVLTANPEVIVAGSAGESPSRLLNEWRRWDGLSAVKNNRLFLIPRDLMVRHSPRILDGAERLCTLLDDARRKEPIGGIPGP